MTSGSPFGDGGPGQAPAFTVSGFVAAVNQTFEYAYPAVQVTGELANFRVSKNRWVYFDLKDEAASVRCFGSVYQLPGPLEDGMLVTVWAAPRLHPLYNFSLNFRSVRPAGEGSIKKAANLLEAKLRAEGLFAEDRKRPLPYPPAHIGLITSGESAAYHDFMKIAGERWGGLRITCIDVQVQGEAAVAQIVAAIEQLGQLADIPETLVLVRGGGSADDLQVFSTEQVVRAVAGSRIPTLVAIGHEVDISLAELAADRRASTPSNAAELLVPDRRALLADMPRRRSQMHDLAVRAAERAARQWSQQAEQLRLVTDRLCESAEKRLELQREVLRALDPSAALRRGYALLRLDGRQVTSGRLLHSGDLLEIEIADAAIAARAERITIKKEKPPA